MFCFDILILSDKQILIVWFLILDITVEDETLSVTAICDSDEKAILEDCNDNDADTGKYNIYIYIYMVHYTNFIMNSCVCFYNK